MFRALTISSIIFWCIAPFAFMFWISITSTGGLGFVDAHFAVIHFENYKSLIFPLNDNEFVSAYMTTSSIAFLSGFLSVCVGFPAGYWISKRRYSATSIVSGLIGTRIVPPVIVASILGPFFGNGEYIGAFGLLVIVHAALSAPVSTAISASIDWPRIGKLVAVGQLDGTIGPTFLTSVFLNSLVAASALAFGLSYWISWTDFFFSLMLSGNSIDSISVYLAQFETIRGTDWGRLAAATVLLNIPILIIGIIIWSSMRRISWFRRIVRPEPGL